MGERKLTKAQVASSELKRLAKASGGPDYVKVHVDTLTHAADLLDEAGKMAIALEPFSDAVFNDNGDMTVNLGFAQYDDYVRAYFAFRRSALEASNG